MNARNYLNFVIKNTNIAFIRKMSDSIFTKIIKREIPATILYEDDKVNEK